MAQTMAQELAVNTATSHRGEMSMSATAPELAADGDAGAAAARPVLAAGVELSGEMQGTGFRDRQWLIRRGDRFVQVTELVYRTAEFANGQFTLDEIAERVTEATDWQVSADQVRHIIQTMLIPRGIVAPADSSAAFTVQESAGSPLTLTLRKKLLGPRALDSITNVLQWFYAPPILLPTLLAIVIAHWWLYRVHDVMDSLLAVLYTPGGLLVVLGATVINALFHELGHAAALRYGGGTARGLGAGLYLIYPVFYTDVTDSYRLGRGARVRTDLGGFYFDLIFALGTIAAALITGQEFLLVLVLLINLEIIYQCLPFVRLDGYWALADLTGIPDFFSQLGPFTRSLLPAGASTETRLPPLRPYARAVFICYIILTFPVLVVLYLFMVKLMPFLVTATRNALLYQIDVVSAAGSSRDVVNVLASVSQILLLALPMFGMAYILYSTLWRLLRWIWRWSTPTPARRVAGALATVGLAGILMYVWVPGLFPASETPTVTGESAPTGIQRFAVRGSLHVRTPVTYDHVPPVGGNHAPIWQNCGFYDAPVPDMTAVHSLEHGAVWITYRPDLPAEQVGALRQYVDNQSYVLASPYPNLPAPVIASVWGNQLRLDSADDPRLDQFIRAFRGGRQAPEPGGPCTDGVGAPL
jgi:putative peptide zinc metalloprotease protein